MPRFSSRSFIYNHTARIHCSIDCCILLHRYQLALDGHFFFYDITFLCFAPKEKAPSRVHLRLSADSKAQRAHPVGSKKTHPNRMCIKTRSYHCRAAEYARHTTSDPLKFCHVHRLLCLTLQIECIYTIAYFPNNVKPKSSAIHQPSVNTMPAVKQ